MSMIRISTIGSALLLVGGCNATIETKILPIRIERVEHTSVIKAGDLAAVIVFANVGGCSRFQEASLLVDEKQRKIIVRGTAAIPDYLFDHNCGGTVGQVDKRLTFRAPDQLGTYEVDTGNPEATGAIEVVE